MNITGIVVVYNTPKIIKKAVGSIRKYYPQLPIIIIDGSPPDSECHHLTNSMRDSITIVEHIHKNIGHGPGMCMGVRLSSTPYLLFFDSDIEMKSPCLEDMFNKLTVNQNIYGVGKVVKVNHYGINDSSGIQYLHPHFMLVSKRNYSKFFPFVQHGAPCIKAMIKLSQQNKISLIDYKVENYVLHKERGTRHVILKEGWKKAKIS